ncbi:uncharacterized protein F5Z01DRAFT_90707 [Emericellopsis atlantica]|uniref:Uncharacterized protein n=1 Tax=Emericellopsis atlantica TaxID=2614577 RepID=A0A9P7ZNF6_9HYPO|nr:uncharacterized protein F5Z01DRAFT_90707 [Emericellopsis atlantica]KAG9254718.1 hypothetical protein F5Z01DRAFT_90707 [Emericellopsis atlantica]
METVNMADAQSFWDTTADYNRKRGRDEDQDMMGNGPCSFSEHRNKRLQQSLPMRMSPKSGSQFLPASSVTPLNAAPAQLRHSHLEASSYLQAPGPSTTDSDMDMATDSLCSHHGSNHLAPEADNSTATQRMPTPVQPSFAAQVRGQQHHWNNNNMEDMHSVPRTLDTQTDWQSLQNNRRLPSPISEYEDGMNVSLQPPSPHGMEHPNATMGLEGRASSHPPEGESPSPERRGHMRSKHTINTWTWQPGMKKSFSVGYRQDCEKCRLKVPGHFNHIIIS